MTSHSALPDGDRIDIRIPAEGVYVATLRMCAASLGARCDLTVDDIEDLRLAVDEACALLLPHASAGQDGRTRGDLEAAFTLRPGELRVDTCVAAADGALWLTTSNKDGHGRPVAADERVLRITPTGGNGGDSPT